MEKDDCQQRLQRSLKELRHSKTELRELVVMKRSLKAKVTALESELGDSLAKRDSEDDSERGSTELPTNELLERRIEEMEACIVRMEGEQLQLTAQLEQYSEVERELTEEGEELRTKLNSALLLIVEAENHIKDKRDQEETTPTPCSHEETQTEVVPSNEQETQVNSLISSGADKAIQVDTLLEICTQYQKESEMRSREVSILKEKLAQSSAAHKNQLKEAESKIHQLLSFKERLTIKNSELQREIESRPKETDYQKKISSALYSIQALEDELCGVETKSNGNSDGDDTQLKNALAEIEKLKKDHSNEKQEMRQKVATVVAKVKEKELKNAAEMNELKAKLETAQKHLRSSSHALSSNGTASLGSQHGPAGPTGVSDNSTVSFMEIESVTPHKMEEGVWGFFSEAVFRGKSVGVRCLTKESLARFSIQEIHKQIGHLVQLRHPNIVLFLAASLDTPSGMMIITELLTCSLRQAYEARLMPDKLPVMLDVAAAINFLHLQKKPVIHGNLSSCAVMVEEGSQKQWKAKLSDIGTSAPLMTLSEISPVYLAPELEGQRSKFTSPALDVYSFGVLLCEVAASYLPTSPEEFPGVILGLKDSLPQVAFLVQCCTAASPEERPKMASLVKKLKNLVVNKITMP